ncbi:MAG: sensor histidine kinase N-terminal domain-containing protein [Burkholderiaceae bacterium]
MNKPERLPSVIRDLLATREPGWTADTPALREPPSPRHPDGQTSREPRSLFGEVLDFMLAPLLMLWPLSIIVTLFVARSLADAPYDQALRERAMLLAQQVQFFKTPSGIDAIVPGATHSLLNRDQRDLRYQVIDSRGRPIFGDSTLPPPSLYDFPQLGVVQFRTVPFNNADLRVAYTHVPVRVEEDLNKPLLVQVAEDFDSRSRLASSIIKGVIFPQFIILPIAAALVWFGLSRGLRPLRGLRNRIRARRPDDLSPIDTSNAPLEIVPLLEAFNHLLGQLQHNLATQRRFIADAAHQIKTPLAGIHMQAELALRADDPTERQRSLSLLARSSERASHLVNQLLALARAEAMGETTRFEQLDLNELARDALVELAPLALEAGLDIGFEGTDEPAPVQGNRILLGELVLNLVTNAIRYTPTGGTVTVRVLNTLGLVTLEVEDNGPGIPASERESVFERFYRLRDRPASNEGEARGSGLGLAIVREIARLHRARITVADGATWPDWRGQGCGALFIVRFEEPAPL